MSLQIQLRRGVIALIIGLALCGLAISRGGHGQSAGVHGVGSVIRAVDSARHACDSRLRIEVDRNVALSVACASACAPLGRVLNTLHVTTREESRCVALSA
jgi:hypothetical protein